MKYYLLTCLLLVSAMVLAQDTFTVLFVKGEITIGSSGAKVQRGAKLSSDDKLIYGSDQDMIAAISPGQGRVILKPQKDKVAPGSELAFVINDIFMPVKSNAMTRFVGEDDMAFANDFVVEAYFSRDHYAVLDQSSWLFDTEEYPIGSNDYFAIRMKRISDGAELTYKLNYEDGRATVVRKDLFDNNGSPIRQIDIASYELIYAAGGKSRVICSLPLVFPDLKILNEELMIFKNSGVKYPLRAAKSYVQETYGYCDEARLASLFNALP